MKKSTTIVIICFLSAVLICGCTVPALPNTQPSTENTQTTPSATATTAPSATNTHPTTEPPTHPTSEPTAPPSTDPVLSAEEAAYLEAEALLAEGKTAEAAIAFGKLAGYADARERSFALWNEVAVRHTIATTGCHSFAILESGEVVYGGEEYLETEGLTEYQRVTEAVQWKNIIALDANFLHILGLHPDGTVSFLCNHEIACTSPESWEDIIAVSCTLNESYGLRIDGTVVCYPETKSPRYLDTLKDIVAIDSGSNFLLALKSDGTVEHVGGYINYDATDVSGWSDITAIACSSIFALGLRSDGTVLCTDPEYALETDTWTNIVAIFPGERPIGLTADGTILIAGEHSRMEPMKEWENIVDISHDSQFYIGLRADGTLVCCGFYNTGQDKITAYTDIKLP